MEVGAVTWWWHGGLQLSGARVCQKKLISPFRIRHDDELRWDRGPWEVLAADDDDVATIPGGLVSNRFLQGPRRRPD